jgi:hypothetical protein
MEGKRQKAKEKNEIIKQKRDRGRREEKAQRFSPYLPPLTMLHTQLHEITKPNLSDEIICELHAHLPTKSNSAAMSTWSLGDTGDGSTLQNGYLALNSALGLGSSILDRRKAAGVYLHRHVTRPRSNSRRGAAVFTKCNRLRLGRRPSCW